MTTLCASSIRPTVGGVGGRYSRQIPELVLTRILKIYGLFENLYGLLRHASFFIGPSHIFDIPVLVERIEPNCLLHLVDGLFRLAEKDEQITHLRENLGVVRIEFSSAQVMRHRILELPVV